MTRMALFPVSTEQTECECRTPIALRCALEDDARVLPASSSSSSSGEEENYGMVDEEEEACSRWRLVTSGVHEFERRTKVLQSHLFGILSTDGVEKLKKHLPWKASVVSKDTTDNSCNKNTRCLKKEAVPDCGPSSIRFYQSGGRNGIACVSADMDSARAFMSSPKSARSKSARSLESSCYGDNTACCQKEEAEDGQEPSGGDLDSLSNAAAELSFEIPIASRLGGSPHWRKKPNLQAKEAPSFRAPSNLCLSTMTSTALGVSTDCEVAGQQQDSNHCHQSGCKVPLVPSGDLVVGARGSSQTGEDVDTVPDNFLEGCLGNVDEARRRWRATCEWRRLNNIDEILIRPHYHFELIKRYYPHWFHLKSNKVGHYVYIEQPGNVNVHQLAQAGISVQELAKHYVYTMEFFWKNIDRRKDGKLVLLLDCCHQNILFLGEATQMFLECSNILQTHYPERTHAIYIINATWGFRLAWTGFSVFLNSRTASKVRVLGSDYRQLLYQEIGRECLPVEYGGTNPTELGNSSAEKQLRRLVSSVIQSYLTEPVRHAASR